jgi:hypothetical protein
VSRDKILMVGFKWIVFGYPNIVREN